MSTVIASVKIGNQEWKASTLIEGFEITHDGGDRMGTARFVLQANPSSGFLIGGGQVGDPISLLFSPGQQVDIYSTEMSGGGPPPPSGTTGLWGDQLFGEPLWGAGEGGTPAPPAVGLLFSGTITVVRPRFKRADPTGTANLITHYAIEARDWGSLLDAATVDEAIDFEYEWDNAIIQYLIAQTGVNINGNTYVTSTLILRSFHVENESLRRILERLAELTGAEYYVDPSRNLHWAIPYNSAPFSLSENPVLSTEEAFERNSFDYAEDWRTPCNRAVVLGQVGGTGTSVQAIVDNAASQNAYGVFSRTVVDRAVTTVEEAQNRGAVEVARYGYPQRAGRAVVTRAGLEVGQLLTIYAPLSVNVSGSFLIRRLRMTWSTPSYTRYEIEFGDWSLDLARALRRIYEMAKPTALTPRATVAPGSITTENLATGLLLIQSVNELPELPNDAYADDAVVLLTTDRKLYRRDGNEWTADVPAIDIIDQIQGTQISDASISTPKLITGAVTAEKVATNAITAGKIAVDAVTAGCIAAAAIRAQDAAFEVGSIKTADIGDAQITNAKIADLTVTTAKIQNLSVDNLKLAENAVTTGKLQNNSVTNEKVLSITANKVTAGLFTGCKLVLEENGLRTKITNEYGGAFGNYCGLIIESTTTGVKTLVNSTSLLFIGSNAMANPLAVLLSQTGLVINNGTSATVQLASLTNAGTEGGKLDLKDSTGFTRMTLRGSDGAISTYGPINTATGYWVNGAVIVDSFRNFRFLFNAASFSLSSAVGYINCYDADGSYRGRIPVVT